MGISIGQFIASLGSKDQDEIDFVAQTIDSGTSISQLNKDQIRTVATATQRALVLSDANLRDNHLSQEIIKSGQQYVDASFVLKGIDTSHSIIKRRSKES